MMTVGKLEIAIKEAERFVKKAKEAKTLILADKWAQYGCKQTAAAKRASMDLTRALAEMRKP